MTMHYVDIPCPNCGKLLQVPLRIGQVHCNPKSMYLVNMSASVKHVCGRYYSEVEEGVTDD